METVIETVTEFSPKDEEQFKAADDENFEKDCYDCYNQNITL